MSEDWVKRPSVYRLLDAGTQRNPGDKDGAGSNSNPRITRSRVLNATEAGNQPTAVFRLMARCSIDFHVLSLLWMMVGNLFDKRLSCNVFGIRLRRNRHGEINTRSLVSLKAYLRPFREWRDGGIKAMRTSLSEKRKVLALTADVSSFYHELSPGFMLEKGRIYV